MLLGAFRPPKRDLLRYALDGPRANIFVHRNLPSLGLCKAGNDASKFSVLGLPQGKIVAGPPGAGFGG